MFKSPPTHLVAALQALLVTFLWSTSWVLVKKGLVDIPPVTFAGLRYGLAFLCLLPFFLHQHKFASLRKLSKGVWVNLISLGVLYYAITQGAQFVGLTYLPAVTVNILLSFTSIVVALMGILLLRERPVALQGLGIGVSILGALLFFYPITVPSGQVVGFIAVITGLLANAGSSILGRHINRTGNVPPLTVTIISMGVGAIVLLTSGILIQGMPRLSPGNWIIIAWLAVVNTAFAFTLWNHTLRTLPAMESTVINNTMLIQIALLAWLFLGEQLTLQKVAGLVVVGVGTLMVQIQRKD